MRLVRDFSRDSRRTSFVSDDVTKSAEQPSERRFDKDALSRMDDEGGSNEPAVNPPNAARKGALGG